VEKGKENRDEGIDMYTDRLTQREKKGDIKKSKTEEIKLI
jgi:hypothetical protein